MNIKNGIKLFFLVEFVEKVICRTAEFSSKMENPIYRYVSRADVMGDILKSHFSASAMNICQTQALFMMNMPKMTVEFKEGSQGTKAKRTSRVIPVPLAMREQTKKDLDSAVKMVYVQDLDSAVKMVYVQH